MTKRNQVTVTISGAVGNGKSAVYHEIVIALKAAGIEVRHENETEYLNEAGMTEHLNYPGDKHAIEQLNPIVTMYERVSK